MHTQRFTIPQFLKIGLTHKIIHKHLYATLQLSQHALLRASEARVTGVLSKGGKIHGVATNVYLWKNSEKPKETGQNENSKFGSCIYV